MKLSEICEFIIDSEHKTSPTQDSGFPYIRTPNIGRGMLKLTNVKYISEENYKLWTKREIPRENDLILAREAPLGNVAIIPKNLDVCLGQRTVLIRVRKEKILPEFLMYLLLTDYYQMKLHSFSTGATVSHLNLKDLRELEITNLPAIKEQRKRSNVLTKIDRLIENNKKRIKILEEIAHMIYHEWFVKYHYPDHEEVPLGDSGTYFGKIPKGWKVSSITNNSYIQYISENISHYKGYKEYFATANIEGTEIIKPGELYSFCNKPSRAQKKPELYSVWFARMKDTYKVLGFTDSSKDQLENMVLSSGFIGLKSSKLVFPFLYYTVNSTYFHKKKDLYATGATQVSLNNEGLSKIEILIPEKVIIVEFGKLVLPILDMNYILYSKNKSLLKIRELMLSKVISGQIEVQEMDIKIDEEEKDV